MNSSCFRSLASFPSVIFTSDVVTLVKFPLTSPMSHCILDTDLSRSDTSSDLSFNSLIVYSLIGSFLVRIHLRMLIFKASHVDARFRFFPFFFLFQCPWVWD